MKREITYVSDSGYSYLTATIESGAVDVIWTYDGGAPVNTVTIFEGKMSIPEFTVFLNSKGSQTESASEDWMEVSEVSVSCGEAWPPEGFEEDLKDMSVYERYTPNLA